MLRRRCIRDDLKTRAGPSFTTYHTLRTGTGRRSADGVDEMSPVFEVLWRGASLFTCRL